MRIIIDLGVRYGDPVTINRHALDRWAEMNPEHIFDAMQRVGHPTDPDANHTEADLERITAQYDTTGYAIMLRMLRRQLDHFDAPSMSSGDIITLIHDDGTPIVQYVCEAVGWTTRAPAPLV